MTPQEFKVRHPEFASIEDGRIYFLMNDALAFVDEGTWSDLYSRGLALVVAHFLAVDALLAASNVTKGASGNVASKSVGPVSISYDTGMQAQAAQSPFMKTAYGQQYLYLARMVGMGGLSI